MSAFLSIRNLDLSYGPRSVLHSFSLEMNKGETACLLGPSGSGKTSLLRAIAGFEKIQAGEIQLENRILAKAGQSLSPEERGIGFVFQDFALFPHLKVSENIAFGLVKRAKKEQEERVQFLLDLVGLTALRENFPHQLSGGERQRVALARALAPEPRLLLLDEPLSQLDPDLRSHLARQIRQILKQVGTTALMVTHSQTEAFDFGDRIALMDKGRLHQFAEAYSLYHEPSSRFVADFVGQGRWIEAKVAGSNRLETEFGPLEGKLAREFSTGSNVELFIRPDDLVFDAESSFSLEVVGRSFRGPYFLYEVLSPGGIKLLGLIPSHHAYEEGERIPLRLEMEHLICFPLTKVESDKIAPDNKAELRLA